MKDPHPSYRRLIEGLQIVGAIPKDDWRPADVQQKLNISAQRANNWVDRGVSQDGAAEAQAEYGINLHWILSGTGAPLIGSPAVQPNDWPFKKFTKAEYDELDDWKKLYLEDVVIRLVANMGQTFAQMEERAIAGIRTARKSSNGK